MIPACYDLSKCHKLTLQTTDIQELRLNVIKCNIRLCHLYGGVGLRNFKRTVYILSEFPFQIYRMRCV